MKHVWNRFFVNFINGIAILLPIAVTIILIRFLVLQLNNIVLNPIMRLLALLGNAPEHIYIAKVIIFFIAIFIVALVGWGAKILVINRIFSLGEKVLLKVPIMGRIYNAIKQIFSGFFGHGKSVFKQVVLVEYPRKGVYSVGFVTGNPNGELKNSIDKDSLSVFMPTTPNPTTGVYIIVPREEIKVLNMSLEDGMKLIISGGAIKLPE